MKPRSRWGLILAAALVASCAGAAGPAGPGDGEPAREPARESTSARPVAGSPSAADFASALDLAALLEHAAGASPRIAAARAAFEAALEKRPQVVALPDPMFATGPEFDDAQGLDEWKYTLTQPIPFPEKLALEGTLADDEAEISRLEYLAAVTGVVTEIRESYHELAYLDRAANAIAMTRELFARYAAFAALELERAGTNLPETFRAQAQLAQLEYDLVRIRELREVEAERLRTRAALAPGASVGPAVEFPFDSIDLALEEIQILAGATSPEIRIADAAVAKAETGIDLARAARLPDFELGLTYEQPVRSGNEDEVMAMFGITIPLWEGKTRARVREAVATRDAAVGSNRDERLEVRAEVTNHYYDLSNAQRLVRLYRDRLLPEATEAMAAAEQLYRTGQASFAATIETAGAWYNFQLAYHRAIADHAQATARLEGIVGAILDPALGAQDAGEFLGAAVRAAAGQSRAASPDAGEPAREKIRQEMDRRVAAWQDRAARGGPYGGWRAFEGDLGARRLALFADESSREAALAEKVEFEEILVMAALASPSVREAREKWRATLEQYSQAGYLEDLLLQYDAFTRSLEVEIGESPHRERVETPYPFPGRLSLAGELVDRQVEIAWEGWRDQLRQVLVETGHVHHELEYFDRAIEITNGAVELLTQVESVALSRYRVGEIPQIDLLRIQSERAREATDLATLVEERTKGLARLNSLLGRDPDLPLGRIVPVESHDPDLPIARMIEVAFERRPDLLARRLGLAASELAIRLAETELSLPFPGRPEAMPRFQFGAGDAYIRELRRRLDEERAAIEALERSIEFAAKQVHFDLDRARREVALHESVLVPQAAQALETARPAYETGKLGFLDFLGAGRAVLDARLGLERARRDSRIAVNRLSGVLGVDPPGP